MIYCIIILILIFIILIILNYNITKKLNILLKDSKKAATFTEKIEILNKLEKISLMFFTASHFKKSKKIRQNIYSVKLNKF